MRDSVPLLRLTVHLLVEPLKDPLHIPHGKDADRGALGRAPMPVGRGEAGPEACRAVAGPAPAPEAPGPEAYHWEVKTP